MNLWKPLAIAMTTTVTLIVGYRAAFAHGAPAPEAGACHDQPNMAAALSALRGARAALDKAEHDKGGWRTSAISAANTAIAQAERGCAFAR